MGEEEDDGEEGDDDDDLIEEVMGMLGRGVSGCGGRQCVTDNPV